MMELLVSIAILGIVAVGFLGALIAGYHGVRVAHDQTMAQNLTRVAMENVATGGYPVAEGTTTRDGLEVEIEAHYIDADYGESATATQMQMVTVTIRYEDSGDPIKVTRCVKAQQ